MPEINNTDPTASPVISPQITVSDINGTDLLKQLTEAPALELLEIACERVEKSPYNNLSRAFESELRKLLNDPEHQANVLEALSKYAVQNLDSDLAWLLPLLPTDAIPEHFEKVLTAIACSGGAVAIKQLDESIQLFKKPELEGYARQAINILASRDLATGVLAAFRFFDIPPMPEGTDPIDLTDVNAEFLKDMVSQSRYDQVAFRALSSVLKFFITTDAITNNNGMIAPVRIPSPPKKLEVSTFILENLIAENSAFSLSAALQFYEVQSPEIDAILDATDFSKVGDEFYSLPSFAYVVHSLMFPPLPMGGAFGGDPTPPAEMPMSKWATKFSIKHPLELPAISAMDFRIVEMCRANQSALTGLPARTLDEIKPSSREFHIEAGTHVFKLICKKYALSTDVESIDIPELAWDKDREGNPFSSFSALAYRQPLAYEVSKLLGDPDPAKNQSLAEAIVCKEQGVIALQLYAILLLLREQETFRTDVTVINSAQILEELVDGLDEKRKVSRLVDRISQEVPLQSTITTNGSISLEVTDREIDLSSGFFRERCTLKSGNQVVGESDWIGSIPISYVQALSTHTHLLDVLGLSLAERELQSEVRYAQPVRTPMEAILNFPEIFIDRFLQAINDPTISLKRIDEALKFEGMADVGQNLMTFPVSSEKAPNPKPSTIGYGPFPPDLMAIDLQAIEEGFPGGIAKFTGSTSVAFDDAEYEKIKPHYLRGFNYFVQFQAQQTANEFIRPRVNDMPDDLPRNFLEAFFMWIGLADRPNWAKFRMLEEINATNASLSLASNYLRAWDLGSIENQQIKSVYLRNMLIHPSYTKFLAMYELTAENGTTRFANFEGNLPEIPLWLKRLLQRDPGFLQRYDLDISGATMDAADRIMHAASRHYISLAGLMSPIEILDRQNLFYANAAFQYAPALPILNTSPAGAILSSEINTIKAIREMSSAVPPATDRTPNPSIVAAVRDQWRSVQSIVQTEARKAADKVIESINQASRRDWVIGVSFTASGGVTYLGLNFNTKDFGVSLSTTLNGDWALSGSLMQIPFVTFNLALPTQQILDNDPSGDFSQAATESAIATGPLPKVSAVRQFSEVLVGEKSSKKANINSAPSYGYSPNVLWGSLGTVSTTPVWNVPELDRSERAYMFQMYMASVEKFNAAEQKVIAAAFSSADFPPTLRDMIANRTSENWESRLEEGKGLLKTSIEEAEDRAPAAADSAFIEETNRKNAESFDSQIASAQARCATKECFVDGLPIASVAYSHDASTMNVRYTYNIIDGTSVVRDQAFIVPDFLRQAVTENPNGHALEFYQLASSREFLRQLELQSLVFANANKPMLEAIDEFMQREITANTALARQLANAVPSDTIPSFKRYIDDLNNWLQTVSEGAGVPFVPNANDIAASTIFISPSDYFDRAIRRNSFLLEQTAMQRLYAPFMKIREGSISLQEMGSNTASGLTQDQFMGFLSLVVNNAKSTTYTKVAGHSNYLKLIDRSTGRLTGYTRNWGDAPAMTQVVVMKKIVQASNHLSREDQAILLAIARVESGYNPDAAATSTSASGIFQFIKRTGAVFGLSDDNRFDAEANIRAGVKIYEQEYLKTMRNKYPTLTGEERIRQIYILHHDGPGVPAGSATAIKAANEKIIPFVPKFLRILEDQQNILP